MEANLRGTHMGVSDKSLGEMYKRPHLSWGGRAVLEVSDKTNAYAVLVVFVGGVSGNSAMSAVLLLFPPGTDLDFSVWRIRAVANDEMITQLVHASAPEVFWASVSSVEPFGSSGGGGAVMNDDVLPSVFQIRD